MGYDIGNTPAYAGKTLYERDARGGTRKHPRLRGEDEALHVAGLHVHGNTPAYAGKTGALLS